MSRENGLQVHIIDDDEMMLEVYEVIFAQIIDKYKITSYLSRTDFLNNLNKHKNIDLVICDIILPDGNGLQLNQNFKELGIDIPIIFITSLGQFDTEASKGLTVLGKPVNKKKLVKAIAEAGIGSVKLRGSL